MKDILQALFAIVLCVLAFCAIQYIKQKLLLPVKCGRGVSISILVEASGSAHCLENTLKCAEMLQGGCGRATYIIIEDDGLDLEARKVAELFVAKNPLSELRRAENTGDKKCSQRDSTSE